MKNENEYNIFMKKYNDLHKCCLKCGALQNITTLVGYALDMNNKESYKDLNTCLTCGDKHSRDKRVPEKT